jgi:hypothetical protein
VKRKTHPPKAGRKRPAQGSSPRFLALLDESEKSLRDGKGLSWGEFWAEAQKLP